MEVAFPAQIKNDSAALIAALKRMLEADKLVIQTDQHVLVIPWQSVQHVEASTVVWTALPDGAIRGARVVQMDQ
jgi:hypothetical protein